MTSKLPTLCSMCKYLLVPPRFAPELLGDRIHSSGDLKLKEYVTSAQSMEETRRYCSACSIFWPTIGHLTRDVCIRSHWYEGDEVTIHVDTVDQTRGERNFIGWIAKDMPHRLSTEDQFDIPYDVGSRSPQLFKYFQKHFNRCCQQELRMNNPHIESPLPTRVLDLTYRHEAHDIRLIESNGQIGRYAILSYTWGANGQANILKKEKLANYLHGFTVANLDETIKDAIVLTKSAFDLRYLWIDAFCIIQDDELDALSELPKMADYYGYSAITIAASCAENAQKGFLKESTRQPSYSVPIPIGETSSALILRECMGRTDLEIALHGDIEPLDQRAWCLQERLLSHRFISFPSFGVEAEYWCSHGVVTSNCRKGSRLDFRQNLQTLLQAVDLRPADFDVDDKIREIKHWHEIVNNYSKRAMTKYADKLRAIEGLVTRFYELTSPNEAAETFEEAVRLTTFSSSNNNKTPNARNDYCAGLWGRHIHECLLWRPHGHSKHYDDNLAPSWSWASTEGEVFWPFEGRLDKGGARMKVEGYHILDDSSNSFRGTTRSVLSIKANMKPIQHGFEDDANDMAWSFRIRDMEVQVVFDEEDRHNVNLDPDGENAASDTSSMCSEPVQAEDNLDDYLFLLNYRKPPWLTAETVHEHERSVKKERVHVTHHRCKDPQELFCLPVGQIKGMVYGLLICGDVTGDYSRIGLFKCTALVFSDVFDGCVEKSCCLV